MVLTTKIKELQYYTRFNEVFVLSAADSDNQSGGPGTVLVSGGQKRETKEKDKDEIVEKKNSNGNGSVVCCLAIHICGRLQQKQEQVVIYSNADEEAVEAMKQALGNQWISGQIYSSVLRYFRAGRKASG